MQGIEWIKEQVKSKLKPVRYQHTLGVVKYAVMLADVYDLDQHKIETAALLHDFCKYESDQAILSCLEKQSDGIHPVILNQPNLGHGYMASIVLKDIFGIQDEEILSAIKHHTFGKPHMSDFEKVIYLADSLEENRQYNGIEIPREASLRSLDEALFLVAQNTLIYEIKHGHMIHENTVLMLNALLEAQTWR